jgi:hypothetical protein
MDISSNSKTNNEIQEKHMLVPDPNNPAVVLAYFLL